MIYRYTNFGEKRITFGIFYFWDFSCFLASRVLVFRMRYLNVAKISAFSVNFCNIFRGMIYQHTNFGGKRTTFGIFIFWHFSIFLASRVLVFRMRYLKVAKFSAFSVNFFNIFRGMIYQHTNFGGKRTTFGIFYFWYFSIFLASRVLVFRMRYLKVAKISAFSVNFFNIFVGMIYRHTNFGGKRSTFGIFNFGYFSLLREKSYFGSRS